MDILKLLATTFPFTWTGAGEVIAVITEHVPVIAVDAEFSRVVGFFVADCEGCCEGTPVLQHGDCDVCRIFDQLWVVCIGEF